MATKKTSRRKSHPIYDRESTPEEIARARAWCEAHGAYDLTRGFPAAQIFKAPAEKRTTRPSYLRLVVDNTREACAPPELNRR
jgi:hypothetical protein